MGVCEKTTTNNQSRRSTIDHQREREAAGCACGAEGGRRRPKKVATVTRYGETLAKDAKEPEEVHVLGDGMKERVGREKTRDSQNAVETQVLPIKTEGVPDLTSVARISTCNLAAACTNHRQCRASSKHQAWVSQNASKQGHFYRDDDDDFFHSFILLCTLLEIKKKQSCLTFALRNKTDGISTRSAFSKYTPITTSFWSSEEFERSGRGRLRFSSLFLIHTEVASMMANTQR